MMIRDGATYGSDWVRGLPGFRLVDKVNRSIGQDPDSPFLVGVLDIYGFESFKFNR